MVIFGHFRCFQAILDGFMLFYIILDCFSLFLTLVSTWKICISDHDGAQPPMPPISGTYSSSLLGQLVKKRALKRNINRVPNFKSTLSGLRQFLAIKNSLKWRKNVYYFTSKALFVLKIFNFLSWLFGHVKKQLDKVNLTFYDIPAWLANNCNTCIAQYLEK